jgi:capsid protein
MTAALSITQKQVSVTLAGHVSARETKSLGYNSIQNKGRRKAPRVSVKKESQELKPKDRLKLIATIKELGRNSGLAMWILRKHLDYTTKFTLQINTGDKDVDKMVEKGWKRWGRKNSCDILRRDSFEMMMRMHGAGRAFDGDSSLLLLDGYKLQGIESDRITKPSGVSKDATEEQKKEYERIKDIVTPEGFVLDENGAVEEYIICKRVDSNNYEFEQAVNYQNIVYTGDFFRFDQDRGISKLNQAVNSIQDLEECNEATLQKVKSHALQAIAISSDAPVNEDSNINDVYDEETGEVPTEETSKYAYQPETASVIEMDQGDKMDLIESKTPSMNYQEYTKLLTRLAMLSFDLPYSFFDTKGSSYHAARLDRAGYELSASNDRSLNLDAREQIAEWVLPEIVRREKITLPEGKDIVDCYEWVQLGTPWIDELREVNAAAKRIALNISSHQLECKRKGLDFTEILEQRAEDDAAIKEKGVVSYLGGSGEKTITEQSQENEIRDEEIEGGGEDAEENEI